MLKILFSLCKKNKLMHQYFFHHHALRAYLVTKRVNKVDVKELVKEPIERCVGYFCWFIPLYLMIFQLFGFFPIFLNFSQFFSTFHYFSLFFTRSRLKVETHKKISKVIRKATKTGPSLI